jgi:undecaprenyl diphosphate synthase
MPRHIAIIMDGNGRWAKARGLPRSFGHKAGVDAFRPIVEACGEWGVEALSLFAFSTENWARPRDEVSALMGLIEEYFNRELQNLLDRNVRLSLFGDPAGLPEGPRGFALRAVEKSAQNTGLKLNIALNYGARAEIARAARLLAEEAASGKLLPDEIDETLFASRLYSAGLPDVDLLIRTGGEMRVSNFLLYQIAYAEFISLPCFWPDFGREALADALRLYAGRERRFGKI